VDDISKFLVAVFLNKLSVYKINVRGVVLTDNVIILSNNITGGM
jgi:hypothetical protein